MCIPTHKQKAMCIRAMSDHVIDVPSRVWEEPEVPRQRGAEGGARLGDGGVLPIHEGMLIGL